VAVPVLGAAAVTWAAAAGGRAGVAPLAIAAGAAVLVGGFLAGGRWRAGGAVLGVLMVTAAIVGAGSRRAERSLPDLSGLAGPISITARVAREPWAPGSPAVVVPETIERRGDLEPWHGPPLGAQTDRRFVVGDIVAIRGRLSSTPGRVRGVPVAGMVTARSTRIVGRSGNPVLRLGNLVRARVRSVFGSGTPEDTLLSGFLIGDVAALSSFDREAMRRSGLTHLVAVSGSNVAIVLGILWVVTFPLAIRPRSRAIVGLVGLAVFAAATRWEPSVMRASTMAGLLLVGPVVGFVVDAWTALGLAAVLVLLAAPALVASAGFQLSVAATAGIMAVRTSSGGVWGWLRATAVAATAAQVAVVPLLLVHFGQVPLLSPVANILAAPFATLATAVGVVAAAVGRPFLVELARWPAHVVLVVARTASGWPQLGPRDVALAVLAGGVTWKRAWRPVVATVAVVVVVAHMAGRPGPPTVPTATFVDVGQGDGVLLRDPSGLVVTVDGGRDPLVWHRALRRYGIDRIDLLVATHGDLDHIGALEGVFDGITVGRVWYPNHPDLGDVLASVVEDAQRRGIPVAQPAPGTVVDAGAFRIEVLGPRRRYLKQNDGSVVLWVEAGGRTLLLGGDIEGVAQRELPPLHPDVLLVPHHGSASNDLGWLARTVGPLAIVSVGADNPYGHPDPQVIETLRAAGAQIRMTMLEGDISIPFPVGAGGATGSVGWVAPPSATLGRCPTSCRTACPSTFPLKSSSTALGPSTRRWTRGAPFVPSRTVRCRGRPSSMRSARPRRHRRAPIASRGRSCSSAIPT